MKASAIGSAAFLIIVLSMCISQAVALDGIKDEIWFYDSGVPRDPDVGQVRVVFDATLTQTDLTSGITFSVTERGENGDPGTVLWNIVLDNITDLPNAGTSINMQVGFRVSCDAEGRLLADLNGTYISYCHPDSGALSRRIHGVGQGSVGQVSEVEEYEFALLDENDAMGPNPTPNNAFSCTDGGLAALALGADPWTQLSRAKSKRLNEILAPEDSGSLGVYFDEAGTMCSGTIESGTVGMVYVIAKTKGYTDCGLAGAEFRFEGIPDSWQISPQPNSAIISLGDPFGDGATIGFPCQNPSEGYFVLYSVLVLASEEESAPTFRLEPRNPPTNPTLGCPILTLCDAPVFTGVCVESVPCYVNQKGAGGCSTVAVAEKTWSSVKQLFQ